MARERHADEFPAYLEKVREAQKSTRNLMRLLTDLEG